MVPLLLLQEKQQVLLRLLEKTGPEAAVPHNSIHGATTVIVTTAASTAAIIAAEESVDHVGTLTSAVRDEAAEVKTAAGLTTTAVPYLAAAVVTIKNYDTGPLLGMNSKF